MDNNFIVLIAYIIDKIFGEFSFIKFYKHPVIFMGEYIKWYENKFYTDTVLNGIILNVSLLSIVFCITYLITFYIDNQLLLGFIASSTIASNMLYNSVKDIIDNPNNIKYLVSRDTKCLTNSEINKAAIETYSENLNDGVIAPIFYMFCFGLSGAFIYKAINTLDSMVGYKNNRYKNFGKFSARLDDIVNFIPARITAILIVFLMFDKKALLNIIQFAHLHDSPNAGYPISAMAGVCNVSLGGDTSYFGFIKKKAYFGNGTKEISKKHIIKALSLQTRLDIFIILLLIYINY